MKLTFVTIVRWALGLIYFIFGLNGFYPMLPVPPLAPEAQAFMEALIGTGYMLYFWKSIEVAAGVMLLLNRWVPFALAILSPIVTNIFFFHLFLDRPNAAMGGLLLILQGVLMWQYRKQYLVLFTK